MALWDEQARSTKTFFGEPRSAYKSRTRSGATCLSCAPETIRTGIIILAADAVAHPQVVVPGARRTPVPQVAPTGSDASIADQTASWTARSYWSGQPTCRSQLAVNSSPDCVFMAAPAAGTCSGGSARAARLYPGASKTRACTLSGCCAA